ncbi:ArsR/SmtB family transcription factor [Zavarzinia sp. CC-PAN008]|uniref:ArsR/SmtB family transcription factor n=1 Tax=Zavarzinia sp. CC-PAN008 TaxID=3243332 RepID=UPI003F74569E
MPALDLTLSALADPVRRRCVELLHERPHSAGELASALRLSPPATSRHLKVLRQGGLVAEHHPERDARVRIFSLNPAPLADLRAWAAQMEEVWSEQLAAFKAHLEGAD